MRLAVNSSELFQLNDQLRMDEHCVLSVALPNVRPLARSSLRARIYVCVQAAIGKGGWWTMEDCLIARVPARLIVVARSVESKVPIPWLWWSRE